MLHCHDFPTETHEQYVVCWWKQQTSPYNQAVFWNCIGTSSISHFCNSSSFVTASTLNLLDFHHKWRWHLFLVISDRFWPTFSPAFLPCKAGFGPFGSKTDTHRTQLGVWVPNFVVQVLGPPVGVYCPNVWGSSKIKHMKHSILAPLVVACCLLLLLLL